LYWNVVSGPSRAIKFFLVTNNIEHEEQLVDILKGEHLKPPFSALSPNHTLPVIDDDGFLISEGSAIFRFISGKFSNKLDDKWYPMDYKKRALVNEYLDWHHANLRKSSLACTTLAITNRVQKTDTELNKEAFEAEHKQFEIHLKHIEQKLERQNWLAGEEISFADLQAACELMISKLWKEDFSKYPKISSWLAEIEKLPHWKPVHKGFYDFLSFVTTNLKW